MTRQLELFDEIIPTPKRKRRAKLKSVPPVEAPTVIEAPKTPTAELIAFPASRFVSRIRALADQLRGLREEDERNDAWRAALRRIRIEMLRSGISPETVKAEMREFADAVRDNYWNGWPTDRPTRSGA